MRDAGRRGPFAADRPVAVNTHPLSAVVEDVPSEQPWYHSMAAQLLPVLLGGILAGAGSYIAIDAKDRQQQREFSEARQRDESNRRADVYAQFLGAANEYAVQASSALRALQREAAQSENGEFSVDSAALGGYQQARHAFQGALNNVYVYGSLDGVDAATALARTLPPSLGRIDGSLHVGPPDADAFQRSYTAMLSVMCREVPARPRPSCQLP
jgi:hypothetical protein